MAMARRVIRIALLSEPRRRDPAPVMFFTLPASQPRMLDLANMAGPRAQPLPSVPGALARAQRRGLGALPHAFSPLVR
jgi:hypothetical protein